MKKRITILFFCCLLFLQNSFSQERSVIRWIKGYVAWNPSTFVVDGGDNVSFTGVSTGVGIGFSLSQSVPFCLEVSPNYQVSFKKFDKGVISNIPGKFSMFSLKLPVNLLYELELKDGLSIIPYVGIYARGNIVGELNADDDWYGTVNVFSESEVGEENVFKRFQVGAHAGINLRIAKRFDVGVSYNQDFNEITKDVKTRSLNVSLSYYFKK